MTVITLRSREDLNGIVIRVARCWRKARDEGAPIQQRLHTLLSPTGFEMLAPVFDSVLSIYEATLGRRMSVGSGAISADERMIAGLLDGSLSRRACIDCPRGKAKALDCALCSARIMLAMARDR